MNRGVRTSRKSPRSRKNRKGDQKVTQAQNQGVGVDETNPARGVNNRKSPEEDRKAKMTRVRIEVGADMRDRKIVEDRNSRDTGGRARTVIRVGSLGGGNVLVAIAARKRELAKVKSRKNIKVEAVRLNG